MQLMPDMKVWILVPAAGDLIHATFSNCLLSLVETLKAHHVTSRIIFLPGDSLVTRARNNLAQMFMDNSSDSENHYSLWLDCDILFQPESVLQMLALNLDFVAAPYSKKGVHNDRVAEAARLNWSNDRMMAVAGTPNVNWLAHPVSTTTPMPVLEAGTGFWLLKRKVFEQMQNALPEIKYRRSVEEHGHYGKEGYDYFRVGVWPETKEYLSEDWWFCREWRKLGGTVYCCFWVKTNHIGPYLYPMDVPAIADLLAATGGYINGPTREDKHATPQVRREAPVNGSETGHAGEPSSVALSGHGELHPPSSQSLRSNGKYSSDRGISRAISALLDTRAPDQAAVSGDSGTLGG